MAQWITRPFSERKIAGSIPAKINVFVFLPLIDCHVKMGGLVAQWITRPSTERKIAGSIPAKINVFCFFRDLAVLYHIR